MCDEGMMRIHVMEAHFMKNHDVLKQDPYVKLYHREQEWRTKEATDAGKKPKWSEENGSGEFKVHYLGDDIKIELYDADVGKDDLIGECIIKASALTHPEANPFDEWFHFDEVDVKHDEKSKVHLKAWWTPAE